MAVAEQVRTGSGTWTVDKIHSSAAFEVDHNGISLFRGKFDQVDGTLAFVAGEPRLTGSVEVASIDVADETLKGHLQSPDFFDAERYPQLTFASTAVEYGDGGEVRVEGDLTIKGHTERVETTGRIAYVEADLGGAQRYGVDLVATIDRNTYGVDFNAELPNGGKVLGDEVKLLVHLEFVAAE